MTANIGVIELYIKICHILSVSLGMMAVIAIILYHVSLNKELYT